MREKLTMPVELDIVWSLVADKCESTCVTMFGETAEFREQRHNSTAPQDGKETLRVFDDELNSFINRVRLAGDHDKLIRIITAVANEAAMVEAAKIRERQFKSSIA